MILAGAMYWTRHSIRGCTNELSGHMRDYGIAITAPTPDAASSHASL